MSTSLLQFDVYVCLKISCMYYYMTYVRMYTLKETKNEPQSEVQLEFSFYDTRPPLAIGHF